MSILNVNQIQPVGSGQTITVSASDIAASSATVTASNFTGNVTGNITGTATTATTLIVGTGATISGSTDTIIASTGGAERIRVSAGGSVGIGSDNPTDVLDILTGGGDEVTSLKVKSGGQVELSRSHASAPYIKTLMSSGNPNIILGDSAGDKVLINGDGRSYFNGGNVGIGSEIPGTKLDVLGDIRASSTTNYLGGLRIANFTGYTQGSSTFDLDVTSVNQQSSFFVIAGFNHYGLYSYGCSTVRHVATGPNFTQEILQNQTTSLGGSWTASKVSITTIRITKTAGSYSGGGYYFVSVYAAT